MYSVLYMFYIVCSVYIVILPIYFKDVGQCPLTQSYHLNLFQCLRNKPIVPFNWESEHAVAHAKAIVADP